MCQPIARPNVNAYQKKRSVSSVRSAPFVSFHYQIALWIMCTLVSKEFAIYAPISTSFAAEKTFLRASYKYDRLHTLFDNTVLTWGTDYAIGILMCCFAMRCLCATSSKNGMRNVEASRCLRRRSAALLFCYALSVFVGGMTHQTFTTLDSLNTTSFRILWTICVGAVTAAAGVIGMIGSEICQRLNANADESKVRFRVPVLPNSMWYMYAGYFTLTCAFGGISYKRPACDIFAAGVSQFIPTAYNLLVLLSIRWDDACAIEAKSKVSDRVSSAVKIPFRIMFYVGFLSNAPLLPVYPLLVQYTQLSLGVVNALLHLNLTLSWGMQAFCLHHFCKAMNNVKEKQVM